MTTWHPATKLLLLAAVLAVPYLLLTRPETPAAVAARAVPTDTAPSEPVEDPDSAVSVVPYALPPLEQFTAVVERPLFSPTRRMPPPEEPEVAEAPTTAAPVVRRETGPAEPELHFFGTIRQAGKVAALVSFPDTGAVARLIPGETVGDWVVLQVQRDRLVLGLGDQRRSYEIFASPRPAAAAAREAADGGDKSADDVADPEGEADNSEDADAEAADAEMVDAEAADVDAADPETESRENDRAANRRR